MTAIRFPESSSPLIPETYSPGADGRFEIYVPALCRVLTFTAPDYFNEELEVDGSFLLVRMRYGIVDLGLSVKWASCNLGAYTPEEYGDYYAWGETKSKSDYPWSTYKFGTSSSGPFSRYNTSSSSGTVDNKTVLDPEDDVAHVKLGGKCRMPTDAEWTELRNKCTWTWTTLNGVIGRLVTALNGKSTFLPAAGYRDGAGLSDVGSFGIYWSSSLGTGHPRGAWSIEFYSGSVSRRSSRRCYGQLVRPVSE